MKKEQNAEKTKVRKLARTKEKVSQWTTNPLNEKVLDYHNYEMTKSESVLYFVAAFLVGGVVSQFFYGGLFQEDGVPTLLTYISNSAAFVIVGLLVGKVFLPVRSRQLAEKRRDTLRMGLPPASGKAPFFRSWFSSYQTKEKEKNFRSLV